MRYGSYLGVASGIVSSWRNDTTFRRGSEVTQSLPMLRSHVPKVAIVSCTSVLPQEITVQISLLHQS